MSDYTTSTSTDPKFALRRPIDPERKRDIEEGRIKERDKADRARDRARNGIPPSTETWEERAARYKAEVWATWKAYQEPYVLPEDGSYDVNPAQLSPLERRLARAGIPLRELEECGEIRRYCQKSKIIFTEDYRHEIVIQRQPFGRFTGHCELTEHGLRMSTFTGHTMDVKRETKWAFECESAVEFLDKIGEPDLEELLSYTGEQVEVDYVIPGVLGIGDRVILTGWEGRGKSTLLRQIAMQIAMGVHPFTHESMPPRRVVYIDLENGQQATLDAIRAMGCCPKDGRLKVIDRNQGLDLTDEHDVDWLQGVTAHADVVILGPMYKLVMGDLSDEPLARAVTNVLDSIRGHAAVVVEAHQPYASGDKARPMRAYGSSLFSRWPEFALHLTGKGELKEWRPPRLRNRQWPAKLEFGKGPWPWVTPGPQTAWEALGISRTVYFERKKAGLLDPKNSPESSLDSPDSSASSE